MAIRSGIVALVGRPNVGKSTLMNRLVGDKISIITPMAQTTRNQIRGIQTLPEGQIVYLDTPGIHKAKKSLNRYMVDVAMKAIQEVDAIFYLVDASRPDPELFGPPADDRPVHGVGEDALILQALKKVDKPVFLIINKIDLMSNKSALLPMIERYQGELSFSQIIPISATQGDGTDRLIQETLAILPEGEHLFPPEYATDQAERFIVAEMIREQVILNTRDEIPHSTAVVVESFDESQRDDEERALIRIDATIYLERDSQKGIVIGKRGAMLKQIGSAARIDIESLLGCKVFLQLWVKIERNWSKDGNALRRLGYES